MYTIIHHNSIQSNLIACTLHPPAFEVKSPAILRENPTAKRPGHVLRAGLSRWPPHAQPALDALAPGGRAATVAAGGWPGDQNDDGENHWS